MPTISATGTGRGAIVLAGGEGTRLSSFTKEILGYPIPKQFCPIFGTETMLDRTMGRLGSSFRQGLTLAIVARAHKEFYQRHLAAVPDHALIVEPRNLGTAPAILHGLFRLARLIYNGAAAVFPSDHYISNDALFMAQVDAAFESLHAFPDRVVVLGVTPDSPEVQYGWIEAAGPVVHTWSSLRHFREVRRFYEKPLPNLAESLYRQGCLWNSFIMVGNIKTFMGLFAKALPQLYRSFLAIQTTIGTSFEGRAMERLYRELGPANFCESVLQSCCSSMAVLPLSGIKWCDLGRPERLRAVLKLTEGNPAPPQVLANQYSRSLHPRGNGRAGRHPL